MKVKLLKKVRKKYEINYREKPYGSHRFSLKPIPYNYQLKIPNRQLFLFRSRLDVVFLTINFESIDDAKDFIIYDLRKNYPNLGNYNRQRKIKEQEHKVWYNE